MSTQPTTLAIAALLVASTYALADTKQVTEPFEGIRVIHATAAKPRLIDMWVAEVDPHAPGISFLVTPSNGDLIGDTTPLTVRAFATKVGAQLGVNASFFAMAAKGAESKGQYNVSGLSVSSGDAYSPFAVGFGDAINISKDNVATIIHATDKGPKQSKPKPLAKAEFRPEQNIGLGHTPNILLYNAVSGKGRLVKNGKNFAPNDPSIHPRTATGIKADGKLLFVTVDGREKGRSLGLELGELADVLIGLGAKDAINLDGGGSTTFVLDDPKTAANDPQVMNLPCDPLSKEPGNEHGKERPVGNSLVIFAQKKQTKISEQKTSDDSTVSASVESELGACAECCHPRTCHMLFDHGRR